MKIYVASSWRNEHQQSVVNFLRKCGHEVYYFKKPSDGNAGFHWSEIDPNWNSWTTQQYREALRHEYAQFGFNRDFDAMEAADACVLVLPCGRSAHLEAGWMKGAGKTVFAYIPDGEVIEPELMYNMLDGVTSDINEMAQLLSKTIENDNSATATVTGVEHGNVDKLREAVNLLIDALRDMIMGVGKRDKNRAAIAAGLSALAAPRNCDVGAANEQDERFSAFCNRNFNESGLCDKDCPCRNFNMIGGACSILWGQLPYESEVHK